MRISDISSIETKKISSESFDASVYVSTDSMLSDARGVVFGKSSVPTGRSTQYFKGDVLFSNIRTYFKKIWLADRDGACSNDVLVFRPDPKFLNNRFLYYTLLRKDFTEHSTRTSKGAKMPRGDKAALQRFEIELPSLPEQREIAAILGALDDKIELNRKTVTTLEEIARTFFRSWFVDFDPVHAKREGRVPAHMDAQIAMLFPDSFSENGLPEGWERRSLSAIAIFLNGAALQKFPAKDGEADLPVIKIAELRNGVTPQSSRATKDIPTKFRVDNGDVLFSWSGSLLQKVWTNGPGALNQHLFKVSSDLVPKWFHYFAVDQHMVNFQHIAQSKATTMGHIQRHHLDDAMVCVPTSKIMDAAQKQITPVFKKNISLELENQTLATLRDTLLPRLMSGELRVGEMKEQVKEFAE